MIDRPRFDADDTTTSYSPAAAADRPRWVDRVGAACAASTPPPQTPQHWFDPTWYGRRQRPRQRCRPGTHAPQAGARPGASGARGRPAWRSRSCPRAWHRRARYGLLLGGGHLDPGAADGPPARPPRAAQRATRSTQNVTVDEQSAITRRRGRGQPGRRDHHLATARRRRRHRPVHAPGHRRRLGRPLRRGAAGSSPTGTSCAARTR